MWLRRKATPLLLSGFFPRFLPPLLVAQRGDPGELMGSLSRPCQHHPMHEEGERDVNFSSWVFSCTVEEL